MPGLGLGVGNGMPGNGTIGQEMSDGLLSREWVLAITPKNRHAHWFKLASEALDTVIV